MLAIPVGSANVNVDLQVVPLVEQLSAVRFDFDKRFVIELVRTQAFEALAKVARFFCPKMRLTKYAGNNRARLTSSLQDVRSIVFGFLSVALVWRVLFRGVKHSVGTYELSHLSVRLVRPLLHQNGPLHRPVVNGDILVFLGTQKCVQLSEAIRIGLVFRTEWPDCIHVLVFNFEYFSKRSHVKGASF